MDILAKKKPTNAPMFLAGELVLRHHAHLVALLPLLKSRAHIQPNTKDLAAIAVAPSLQWH
ncbi:hypothetical protein KSX_22560 [Ktedonospora formicarum]|uniref:Uncharacterized protein n=1 Tax=Ktedonospora formicarum TaxID=2778364 RepID=A0A8J3HZY9_9CHLR|nr:hypothetical protein KSX_22560 [Ktedonospora formicarum]